MGSTAERWSEGIAIVGMSARFPGCRSVEEYWAKIAAGENLLTEPTEAQLRDAGMDAAPHLVRSGTYLEDAESFDAKFFELSRREVELMDPQQRILLEVAYEALEHAGIRGDGERVGVFAGVGMNTYMLHLLGNPEMLEAAGGYQLMLGNDKDFAASRVAYKLNLRGPAVVVQTACSTSLAAVHLACRSLLAGECDAALAGGVSVSFPQVAAYPYIPGMILSPDGVCRPFDAKAHGTVPGRGAGMVALKRLSDAERDGDTIYAVIAGSAWNNDGSSKVGYTAPSVEGQAEAIRAAYAAAGVEPERVRYVEAHGTGTELGDPIEIAALGSVLGKGATCVLGAVKSNMGHADVAAGVAGLIKAAMVVKTGVIPPTLHFEQANPVLGLDETRLAVSGARQAWPEGERWAGVSSFGIGGTNVHLCLREAPVGERTEDAGPWVFPVSAKSETALASGCRRLKQRVEEQSVDLGAAAATLQSGRRVYAYRRAVVAADARELAASLEKEGTAGRAERVAFLFPGQGLQFPGMAAGLYAGDEAFRETIDRGLAVLQEPVRGEIRKAIAEGAETDEAAMPTSVAQPLLFLVEYALAMRWMDAGVKPDLLLGHSLGELTAAAVAGVFPFEDGLRLSAERGRLMQEAPEGAMLAVSMPAEEVNRELAAEVWIAGENGPKLTVVSGSKAAVASFAAKMAARRVATMPVKTDRAFHTPDMAEAAVKFEQAVAAVERKKPRIPWLSNVSGGWIQPEEAVSARYWADQMTSRVRFTENAAVLSGMGGTTFLLETGPGDSLTALVKAQARAAKSGAALAAASSLGSAKRGGDDRRAFLEAAARLWESGIDLDWAKLPGYPGTRKTALPTYAFERERYWVEATVPAGGGRRAAEAKGAVNGLKLVKQEDLASWFYALTWRKTPAAAVALPARKEPVRHWVLLSDAAGATGFEDALSSGLEAEGAEVFRLAGMDAEALEAFWQEVRGREGAWGLLDLRRASRDGVADALYAGLLTVLQTALRARVKFAQVEMIAAGLVEVLGEAVAESRRGIVEGLVRMLPAELPGTRVRVIDPGMEGQNLPAVLAELKTLAPNGLTIALRQGARWQEEWLPVRLEGGYESRFRRGGVYLITGGLGGVGFVLARYLMTKYGAKVALLGRSKLPPREQWESWLTEHGPAEATSVRIGRVKELEGAAKSGGGELLLLSADAADRAGMQAAWAEVEARLGAVHGVIHAAGLTANERVMVQTAASVERVLLPKVQGSEVLGELSAGKGLDFLVFCSSISAIHPAPGAAPYAAANAFQDRYAVWCRQALGVPAVSINLDTWREFGMAAEIYAPEGFADVKAALLAKAMSSDEGIEAMERVLATGEARMLISTFVLADVFAETASRLERPAEESAARRSGATGVEGSAEESELAEETRAVMAIWRELLGAEWVGPEENFFELGGHSLLGTMVLARIREQFGVDLTIRAIFEAPTPASLGERIREAEPTREEAVGAGGEREEFEI